MKFSRHLVTALAGLTLMSYASVGHAFWFAGSASWGATGGDVNLSANTISGWTRDRSINGNCIKLKTGQYSEVPYTRTCSGAQNNFSNVSLGSAWWGMVYLYEENSNRTQGLSFGS